MYSASRMNKLANILTVFIITLLWSFTSFGANQSPQTTNTSATTPPPNATHKSTLLSGWYTWQPYEYRNITTPNNELTGMDIELLRVLAAKLKTTVSYTETPWTDHLNDLKAGTKDVASGATYTDERASYAYFSVPYRFEVDSLFVARDVHKELGFSNIKELLAKFRLQNFRLGALSGVEYASPDLNKFIQDKDNADIITMIEDEVAGTKAITTDLIDGFITDRITGAAVILNAKAGNKIEEVPLNLSTPIHFMFSKKSMSLEMVEQFNDIITNFTTSSEYKTIVRNYLYPVLLLQTIDAQWFYIVGIVGTIAFALSGIAIAAKDNSTLFGTLLLAMLPSVGGSIIRDVLLNREEAGIFLTPSYMYCIIAIVLIGFSAVRMLDKRNKGDDNELANRFWDNVLVICDGLGQSAFIVTGVAIALMGRVEPIELWGPFFAFLTANGGCIIRDLLRANSRITCLTGDIHAEVSVIWGVIFSLFLAMTSDNPDPNRIKYIVAVVAIGSFFTRLGAHYAHVPNIRFRK